MSRSATEKEGELTPAAATAALLALTQIAVGLVVVTRPALQTMPILLLLAIAAIMSSVMIACTALPMTARMVLIAGTWLTVLAVSLVQDVFGLRATGDRIATARMAETTPEAEAPPAPPRPSARRGLTIEATGDARATALGSDMAAVLAESGDGTAAMPDVTAMVMVDDDGGTPRYRMSWSIRRGGEHLWCGQAQAQQGSSAAAARSFATLIGQARSIPATEPLRCE